LVLLTLLIPMGALGGHSTAGGPAAHVGAVAFVAKAPHLSPHPAAGPATTIWTNLTAAGVPPAIRQGLALASDVKDNITLMFGGVTKQVPYLNDTWEFVNGVWSNITSTAGLPPQHRSFPTMVYDAFDGYFLLFGGYYKGAGGSNAYYLNDTWKFQAGTWSNLTGGLATAPPPMYQPEMAYDFGDQEAILFGGGLGGLPSGATAKPQNFTWIFHNGAWSNATGTLSTFPGARTQQGMGWDEHDQEVLLYGGIGPKFKQLNDTWIFKNGAWTDLTGTVGPRPPQLRGQVMATDYGDDGYVMMFGGDLQASGTSISNGTFMFRNNTWTDLSKWVGKGLPPAPPPAQTGVEFAGGAWDNATQQILVFAGHGQTSPFTIGSFNENYSYRWANVSVVLSANRTQIPEGGVVIFTSTTHGGTWSYTWSYSGLPTGCSTTNKAQFQCAPGVTGKFNVSVVVVDTHGATSTSNITINVFLPLTPTLSVSPNNIDLGHTSYINTSVAGGASSGGHTYLYGGLPSGCSSSNSGTMSCRPRVTGLFSINVTVTDSVGDQAFSGPLSLLVHPTLTVAVSGGPHQPIVLDAGSTLYLNATAGGGDLNYTYSWTGLPNGCSSANTAALSCIPSTAGLSSESPYTVNVTVTDGTTTTVTATINLNVWPMLIANLNVTPLVGHSPLNVQFSGTVTGGEFPVSTTWQLDNGLQIPTVNFSRVFNTVGNHTVEFWANDSLNITVYRNITIEVLPPVPPLVGALTVSPSTGYADVGQTVTFTASAVGGIGPYAYNWSLSPQPPACTATDNVLTCVPKTTATLYGTVIITDTSGRSAKVVNSTAVHAPLQITATQEIAQACGPSAVNLTASVTGGTRPYAITWTFPGGTTESGNTATHTFTTTGNFSLNVSATDNVGQTVSKNISVLLEKCGGGGTTSGSGFPVIPLALGIVVLIIAIVLAVLLLRRRGSPPPEGDEDYAVAEEGVAAEGVAAEGDEGHIWGGAEAPGQGLPQEEEPTEISSEGSETWPPAGNPEGEMDDST
jgi:hypothetical protein